MCKVKQLKYLLESDITFDSNRYGSVNAYLFSLCILHDDLVEEMDCIYSQEFDFEESRIKELKPYNARLKKVNKALEEYGEPAKEKQKRNTPKGPLVRALINILKESSDLSLSEIRHKIKIACDNTLEFGGLIGIEHYSGSVHSSNFKFLYVSIDGSAYPDKEITNEALRKSIVRAKKEIEKADS